MGESLISQCVRLRVLGVHKNIMAVLLKQFKKKKRSSIIGIHNLLPFAVYRLMMVHVFQTCNV